MKLCDKLLRKQNVLSYFISASSEGNLLPGIWLEARIFNICLSGDNSA